MEALYTIVHRIGKSSLPLPKEQLIKYAQNAFEIDDQTHLTLLDRARKEKVRYIKKEKENFIKKK